MASFIGAIIGAKISDIYWGILQLHTYRKFTLKSTSMKQASVHTCKPFNFYQQHIQFQGSFWGPDWGSYISNLIFLRTVFICRPKGDSSFIGDIIGDNIGDIFINNPSCSTPLRSMPGSVNIIIDNTIHKIHYCGGIILNFGYCESRTIEIFLFQAKFFSFVQTAFSLSILFYSYMILT